MSFSSSNFDFFFSVAVFNFLTDAMGSVLRRLGFL